MNCKKRPRKEVNRCEPMKEKKGTWKGFASDKNRRGKKN
jgi:hypothetical protein